VGKRFGRVDALREVSFDVMPGQRVALVGPNGSGKSTLNRILMGLLAFEGEVRLDGRSPFRERTAVAQRMAYVPQVAPRLGARVEELLAAVGRVRRFPPEAVARAARALELDLDALASRPFRALSGGTKQKLLIALAFAARAGLLIFDEPTGSLDARARERFFDLCEAIEPGTTVLLCSHRLDEVRPLVDHVLFLVEGQLAWAGSAEAFLGSCARSVLEVWAEGESASGWLRAHGFRPTPAGSWRLETTQGVKMKLLPELWTRCGGALRNVVVRDLERLELDGVEAGGAPRA
jgi:ABC-type multidrug transport system ATPase subunit